MVKFFTFTDSTTSLPESMQVAHGPIVYDSFDAIPQPLKAHIARLALLRGVPIEHLMDTWCMSEAWVRRIVRESKHGDVGDHWEGAPQE